MRRTGNLAPILLLAAGIGCSRAARQRPADDKAALVARAGAPLFEGMGDFSRTITTSDPGAQRYFNQGMVLAFGFNHAEAIRSFRAAQKLDPSCAMCFWGEALATGTEHQRHGEGQGHHVAGRSQGGLRRGAEGRVAQGRRRPTSSRRSSTRWPRATTATRRPTATRRTSAYAEAMRAVVTRFPERR